MNSAVNAGPRAFSVPEFCSAYRISRALLYSLWAQGRGPKSITLNGRRLISLEAAEAWIRKNETTDFEPVKAVAPNIKRAASRLPK